MTSSQEIENEIQKKIKNLPSPLKEWLEENTIFPSKINLVSDLVKGKRLEHWVLTKKEAPYFLIYNQKD